MTLLRIGISSLDVAALPVYAAARGAFAAAGIEATIVRDLGHPGDVRDAIVSGELDAGYVDIVTALHAREDLPVAIAAPGALYVSESPVVTLVQGLNSSYASGIDLHRKRVMTPGQGDLAQLGVRTWIRATGGDASLVAFRTGQPMHSASALLASGEVQASIISEPQRTIQSGATKLLSAPFDTIAPLFVMGAYLVSTRWVEADGAAADAFRSILRETARWANQHREETAALLAERLEFERDVANTMTRALYAEELTQDIVEPVARLL